MKHFSKLLWCLCAIVFSNQAMADDECDKYNTSYDKTYCMAKLFFESDNELNVVYKELREKISGSPARQRLTEVQRAWMKHRDEQCQPRLGSINVACNYRENRQRAEYLRDRLRECKAGTCRYEMIGSESWN